MFDNLCQVMVSIIHITYKDLELDMNCLACFPKPTGLNTCAKKRDPDGTEPLGSVFQPTNRVLNVVFLSVD